MCARWTPHGCWWQPAQPRNDVNKPMLAKGLPLESGGFGVCSKRNHGDLFGMRYMNLRLGAIWVVVLALGSCAAPPPVRPVVEQAPQMQLHPASFADLPGWDQEHWSALLPALLKSCARLMILPPDSAVGIDGRAGTVQDWQGPCGAARNLPAGDDQAARLYWESWFSPWLATDNNQPKGIFTGYYEPEVSGSKQRHDGFNIPIYGKPNDLISFDLAHIRPDLAQKVGNDILAGRLIGNGRLDAYPNRSEIESNGLGDKAQVLVWLDDPVAAHILHIQGSGRVRLDDGSVSRLTVAATNGQRFVGLGRILADHGKVEAGATMPAIRDWLKANPVEAVPLMRENPRYIFYREIQGDGPIGAQGVALTAERSMAVDTRFIPLGVPVWLDSSDGAGKPLQRLMIAQDTGAAIKGPVRGDVFWGTGEAAFQQAGRMKSSGQLWLLLPLEQTPRMATAE